jgi:hypothetical protein
MSETPESRGILRPLSRCLVGSQWTHDSEPMGADERSQSDAMVGCIVWSTTRSRDLRLSLPMSGRSPGLVDDDYVVDDELFAV